MSRILTLWHEIKQAVAKSQVWHESSKSVDLEGGFTTQVSAARSSIMAKKGQDRMFWLLLVCAFIVLLVWRYYQSNKVGNNDNKNIIDNSAMNIEVAAKSLDAEKMWRNYFEDKLIDSQRAVKDKIELIENNIREQSSNDQSQLKQELDKLRAQVQYLAAEQASARAELIEARAKAVQANEEENNTKARAVTPEANITVNQLDRDGYFDRPKSSRNYIPETAYVKGILLGGIVVSTSMGSSSEPVPVVIRIVGRGNLPKNFNIDLTHCQIMGSSYGDLSSERAIIRAEVLSCSDPTKELIYTTKVAGIVFGDDGMNGIKGKVVQTSSKHLKNAVIGSMLSGFSGSVKGQEQYAITGLGAIATKHKGAGDLAREGALAGAGNAGEKIADYYIKQAESMSPVLLISGGTKVDVVFTKGVYLGALDVQEKIEQQRNSKAKK